MLLFLVEADGTPHVEVGEHSVSIARAKTKIQDTGRVVTVTGEPDRQRNGPIIGS